MKTITVKIPTGNWFPDGSLEYGSAFDIEYDGTTEDLLDQLDKLSEDEYREGHIDGMRIPQWLAENTESI